jgi:hypothetical protein
MNVSNKNIKETLKKAGFYTDWQLAGIPGGIPKAANIYTELKEGADAAGINKAIQAAGDAVKAAGGASPVNMLVVLLGAGVFDAGGTDIVLDRAGVILRGAGNSTIIRGNTNGEGVIVIGKHYPSYSQEAVDVTNGVKTGACCITVSDAAGFMAGDVLKIDRFADDAPAREGGSEWHNGHNQFMRGKGGEFGPYSGETRPISQYIEIDSVEGNTLRLRNRINIDFPQKGASGKALFPQVWKTYAEDYKYIGLEEVKMQTTAGSGDKSNWSWHTPAVNLRIASCYCWVKNIESDGSYFDADGRGFMGRHIELNGYRNHVTGCYVHHSSCVSPGGNGYGIRFHGTGCVIDDNICDMLNKPLTGQTSNGGNVIAYNYVPNAIITPLRDGNYPFAAEADKPQEIDTWNETAIDTSHGGYSHSDLFEGNYTANIHTDSTSANGWITLFRNHVFGKNEHSPVLSGSTNGIALDGPQGQHASIGNVYLTPANGKTARVWDKPDDSGGGIAVYRFNAVTGKGNGTETGAMGSALTDACENRMWAYDRFFWAYDYNYAACGIEPAREEGWDVPKEELAPSLHYACAPDYFEGYVWPPVNPFGKDRQSRVGKLPAEERFYRLTGLERPAD